MPAGPSDIGITQSTLLLLESVEWSKEVEDKVINATDGSFGQAKAFDPKITFSVKGRGTCPKDLGLVAAGITAITGGATIINKVKDSEKNDDFNSFEYSGENYPSA